MFHLAPDASYCPKMEAPAKWNVEDLFCDIKKQIGQRSAFGVRSLTRIFNAMDTSGNHKLECEEFRQGLGDFGISISPEEAQCVMNRLDSNHDGSVDF